MRKKFAFGFEKLLHHRRQLEDIARRNWLEAQAKVDAANGKMRNLFDEIEQARFRAGTLARGGGAHGPALAQIDEFINGQKVRIEAQRAEIRKLLADAESMHEIVVEAAKERKILEKLRERKHEDFKSRLKKQEIKEIDELVVTRFKRVES